MIKSLFTKVFGDRHEREARKLAPLVDEINSIAEDLASLSEEQLRAQTEKFRGIIRERTAQFEAEINELRERKRSTESVDERENLGVQLRDAEEALKAALADVLEDLLPEAFATVKEACRRLVGTPIKVTGQMLAWDYLQYDVQLFGCIATARIIPSEIATNERN